MRIRSIKPDFWRSDAISSLDVETRLLFIGLWSYVDDNGVGLDRVSHIAADLFAHDLEADPRETFARVSRGLQNLSEGGRITRYTVEGKSYLHITNWEEHQRIDKPNKARYPLPTSENAKFATPSRESRETPAPGAGEQRNRGTGEQGKEHSANAEPAPAKAVAKRVTDSPLFEDFWASYPRRVGKGAARAAWAKAAKKAEPELIIAAAREFALWCEQDRTETRFIAHPSTWLNGERWNDERVARQADRPSTRLDAFRDVDAELAAREAAMQQQPNLRQIGDGR